MNATATMTMTSLRDSNGVIHTGQPLKDALAKVAQDMRDLAHGIRTDDPYAVHVTEDTKDENLRQSLDLADQVEKGEVNGFWLWQKLNMIFTNECVAMLPKP
jgi:hypothetical protein